MKHIIFFTLVLISAQFAKAQNVGIGTNTPYAKLHVVDGLAGMPSTMGTMAIESAASENLLQFKSTEAAKSGILFGGPSNSTRASIVFNPSSNYGGMNITVSTGAGVYLSSLGNVGIGIALPEAKLHVVKGNAAATTAHPNAVALLESSDHGYLQFLNPATKEGGIMFGNPNGTSQGGIYYNNPANPEGLDFRTNGNNVRMTIDNAGNTGIGTADPTAKLDVNGSIRVRSNSPVAGAVLRSTDNLGNITWMKPAAFRVAGLYGNTTQRVNGGLWTKILFSASPEYNEGLHYQPLASNFVAPSNGIYHFDLSLVKAGGGLNHNLRIEAYRGGVYYTLAMTHSVEDNLQISTDVKLQAGDEIFVSFITNLSYVDFLSSSEVWFSGRLVSQL